MLLFKRKTEERARQREVQQTNPLEEIISSLLDSDAANRSMAMQIPSISGTIDLIASIIAATPIKLYQDIDGETVPVEDDRRVFLLNDDTGDTLNASEFWKAVVRDYYLNGGSYSYINKERGRVKSLHYVESRHVTVNKNFDYIFKDFDIIVNGRSYMPFQFLKILRNTSDGAKGVSIVRENSRLIAVMYAALKLELNASKRGGNKKGFLKSEKRLEESAVKALKRAFARLYNDDKENFIVLNNGIDFKESSNTLAEMQLNENKLTNAEEIAKLFHVSTEAVSGKALSTSTLAKLAAVPLMNTIQAALNRDLLLEREKGRYYFAFDTKELLKGEMGERYNAYKTALDANFMQIDEVRYMEDLPPLGLGYIKLGLQDVLYNPKTGQLFTPNTGKTRNINRQVLPGERPDDIMEKRANPYHDPKTGRFSGKSGLRGKTKYASTISDKKPSGVKMSKKKYTELSGKVATAHPEWTSGTHTFFDAEYSYRLTANGFGDYTFNKRCKLK